MTPFAVIAGEVTVGEFMALTLDAPTGSIAFASPKSFPPAPISAVTS
jgi:hypothetical protein